MRSGSRPTGQMPTYPERSAQSLVGGDWWIRKESTDICRGRLIWAFIPHVREEPWILELTGRGEARSHSNPTYTLHTQSVFRPPDRPTLPTAVWPAFENEHLTVYPAKSRPALVISTGGTDVPDEFRKATARWITAPTILVAPYYGAAQSPTRGGWPQQLVERIIECEYPQFIWDIVPARREPEESVLMLNRIQPIGNHRNSVQVLPFCLGDGAKELLNEWITWLTTGLMDDAGVLPDIQSELKSLN